MNLRYVLMGLASLAVKSGVVQKIAMRAIDYGQPKKGGGHDHRTNTGKDRTPAQKRGDKRRSGFF